VIRVAKAFRRSAGLSSREAMHEATWIASTDGLFDFDVVRIDRHGMVELDFEKTFALNLQPSGKHYHTLHVLYAYSVTVKKHCVYKMGKLKEHEDCE
jgi:hypothetical protein